MTTAGERAEWFAEQYIHPLINNDPSGYEISNRIIAALEAAIEAAERAEREACAEIAHRQSTEAVGNFGQLDLWREACNDIEQLIRARSTTETETPNDR